MRLKIREDIQTTPIEVTTSSADVADEEQIFFTQAGNNDESEEQTLERKEQSRQNAKQWAIKNQREITRLKNKCERIHKYRRKHDVVFHEWNQSEITNTSRAGCRSCAQEY